MRDGARVALAPQHLRGREARRAAADDDDLIRRWRCTVRRRRLRHLALVAERRSCPVARSTSPARQRIQRRRAQRLAGAQAEAGVVPGAAHGVADHQPFGERAAVVGAGRLDREDLAAGLHQQHVFLADMAEQFAVLERSERHAPGSGRARLASCPRSWRCLLEPSRINRPNWPAPAAPGVSTHCRGTRRACGW